MRYSTKAGWMSNPILEKISENVVDGGLLIFDLKNFNHSNEVENWSHKLKQESLGGKVEYLGSC